MHEMEYEILVAVAPYYFGRRARRTGNQQLLLVTCEKDGVWVVGECRLKYTRIFVLMSCVLW